MEKYIHVLQEFFSSLKKKVYFHNKSRIEETKVDPRKVQYIIKVDLPLNKTYASCVSKIVRMILPALGS